MEAVLWVVAINWLSPLLLWIYPLSMTFIFKDFKFDGFYGVWAKFEMREFARETWHSRLWRGWGGVGLYGFMCYKPFPGMRIWANRLVKHEAAHCRHWLFLGLSFIFFYNGHMLWIWVTQKLKGKPYTKHPYYDCWSERLARKAAGQKVDLSPKEWAGGKDDLWPWW
jgi:hypothetical protein